MVDFAERRLGGAFDLYVLHDSRGVVIKHAPGKGLATRDICILETSSARELCRLVLKICDEMDEKQRRLDEINARYGT